MRPKKCRRIWHDPDITYFKPAGIRKRFLKEINLALDEFEAIRLKDYECLDQNSASEQMGISQPTFHRLLESARKKVADALVEGKALRIGGGSYRIVCDAESGEYVVWNWGKRGRYRRGNIR